MGYSSQQAKAFIAHIAPMICAEADKRGYKIRSTVIAQAIVEGAAGTSRLAKEYHNHFGMKCGRHWKGAYTNLKTKEEYTPGPLTDITAKFRAYNSDEEGVVGYYDFINTKNYANLKNAGNYVQYAEYLKKDNWATSSTYVNTLVSTVRKYNLYVYDLEDAGAHDKYFPKYEGRSDSLVDALDSLGIDSSQSYRKIIYQNNFDDKYTFSAVQNMALLARLKEGTLIRP